MKIPTHFFWREEQGQMFPIEVTIIQNGLVRSTVEIIKGTLMDTPGEQMGIHNKYLIPLN